MIKVVKVSIENQFKETSIKKYLVFIIIYKFL